MKQKIKKGIQAVINLTLKLSAKTESGKFLLSQFVNTSMRQRKMVTHNGLQLEFAVPNRLCHWRADTFSSKEPETLQWIDSIPEGSVLWDIGANIGLYSTYAAKARRCKVWAFEPSVFNLELLARNIYLNGLSDQVCIVPIALSDKLGSSKLRLTSTEWGGALSTFGHDFGWDGKPIQQVFEFQTLGLSMEDVVNKLSLPTPDYIKMDVDGIEHIILSGGINILNIIKEILIEVNDDFSEQANQCSAILTQAGLVLKEKLQSETSSTPGFENSYNQIWIRS